MFIIKYSIIYNYFSILLDNLYLILCKISDNLHSAMYKLSDILFVRIEKFILFDTFLLLQKHVREFLRLAQKIQYFCVPLLFLQSEKP